MYKEYIVMIKKLAIYDFDGTLYRGDSSLDFFKFCLFKYKLNFFVLPYVFLFFLLWKLKIVKTKKFKEVFLLVTNIKKLNQDVKEFKNINIKKIFPNILKNLKKDKKKVDFVIVASASPEFIVKEFLKDVKEVDFVIATKVINKKIISNCKGYEKVKRLKEKFGKDIKILKTTSDSMDDKPLYSLSKYCYMVSKGKIIDITNKIKGRRIT